MCTAPENVKPMNLNLLNLNPNLNLNNQQVVSQTMIATLDISVPKIHVMPLFMELALNVIAKLCVPRNMHLFVDVMVKPIVTSVMH
jgi:hypothetical protein